MYQSSKTMDGDGPRKVTKFPRLGPAPRPPGQPASPRTSELCTCRSPKRRVVRSGSEVTAQQLSAARPVRPAHSSCAAAAPRAWEPRRPPVAPSYATGRQRRLRGSPPPPPQVRGRAGTGGLRTVAVGQARKSQPIRRRTLLGP